MDTKALGLIIVILVVGIVLGMSLTGLITGGASAGGEWLCLQSDLNTCTQYVGQEEWINQNCAINATGDVLCQVILQDGSLGVIELDKLEIADEVCVQWECLVEVWGRILQSAE